MFRNRRLDRLEATQQNINKQLTDIVTALIVSEPRTGLAAEAYDGLRRSVIAAAQERRRMLSQLVSLLDSIERGSDIATLKERGEQWCEEAGLERFRDAQAQPHWFAVVEGEGETLEAITPAWIDAANSVLVKQGTARAVTPEPPEPEPEPESEAETKTEAESDPEPEPEPETDVDAEADANTETDESGESPTGKAKDESKTEPQQ